MLTGITDIQVNEYFDFVFGWSTVKIEHQRDLLRNFLKKNNLTIRDLNEEMN